MGWIIYIAWMLIAILVNIFARIEKDAASKKLKRIGFIGWNICMWIGIIALGIGLLYVLGWAWYYFCCGFLIFKEPSFFWKIIWGIFTLIPLGFIVGLIAICFGWNPGNKW